MNITTDIDDITWADMTAAGIDIDHVTLNRHAADGAGEYIAQIDGQVRVAFGPAVDMQDGGTHGWDMCSYTWVAESGEGYWQDYAQEWAETKDQLLALVKERLNNG